MDFRGFKASGWFAWLAWLFVHIFYLIGFQNKLFVFVRWMLSYLTFGKGARLIMSREWRSDAPDATISELASPPSAPQNERR